MSATLVCFDPHAGTLKRYIRGVKTAVSRKPICNGIAEMNPWETLDKAQRVVSAEDMEAFRTGTHVPEPAAA